jgi:hypothetical protein
MERLACEFESLERNAATGAQSCPAWDAGLAETEAVRELDAEIEFLQGLDEAARRRYLEWDGNV